MEKQDKTTDLVVTSGASWRQARQAGSVVMLPSGNVIKMRAVPLDQLIITGQLPDLLTPIAAKSLWTTTDEKEIGNTLDLAKGYIELVNRIVPMAVVAPKIVDRPAADDEIELLDLDFGDRVAIFQLATQPAGVLAEFRREQAAKLAAVRNGEGQPLSA